MGDLVSIITCKVHFDCESETLKVFETFRVLSATDLKRLVQRFYPQGLLDLVYRPSGREGRTDRHRLTGRNVEVIIAEDHIGAFQREFHEASQRAGAGGEDGLVSFALTSTLRAGFSSSRCLLATKIASLLSTGCPPQPACR